MRKSVLAGLSALCVGMCAAGAASAAPDGTGFALGVQGGTTGGGVTAQVGLGSLIDLRATGDYLALSHDGTYQGVPYRGHWRGETGGAFVDVHPFNNAFLLSGGAYVGARRLKFDATPQQPTTIGHITYTAAEVGELTGEAKLSDATPFAGLGFNNTFRTDSHWSFVGLIGVAFSGRPAVTLNSTGGLLSDDPVFQQSLAEQQAKISNSVRNYRYYPVATLGVAYRF